MLRILGLLILLKVLTLITRFQEENIKVFFCRNKIWDWQNFAYPISQMLSTAYYSFTTDINTAHMPTVLSWKPIGCLIRSFEQYSCWRITHQKLNSWKFRCLCTGKSVQVVLCDNASYIHLAMKYCTVTYSS